MKEKERTYIAIDLKSFYASAECVKRKLDPLTTNLVVADKSRTEKTICLAVSPSLKAYGIPGRARLFEVIQKVDEINRKRLYQTTNRRFMGESTDANHLKENPNLKLSYLAAPPRMAMYMEISTQIYKIYLKYIAPEDIHVYSIDEVFIDATDYLKLYQKDAHTFAKDLIHEVLQETGITATAGIGTNMFLCKCAMDIVAKHIPADQDGVRICELNEYSFREQLWTHQPLTDFWRIGRGIARRLEEEGMFTMGDIARCSVGGFHDYYNEDLLYKMFGVNAELIIDHAWGYEPTTMESIKAYKPSSNSTGIGQVLTRPYNYQEGMVIVKEMADALAMNLVEKGLMTNQIWLTINYDVTSLESEGFQGETEVDWYGRTLPKSSGGRCALKQYTFSSSHLREAAVAIYEEVVNSKYYIRKVNVAAMNTKKKESISSTQYEQTDLFASPQAIQENEKQRQEDQKEEHAQDAILKIQKKYGKNAIVRGTDFEEGATTIERNHQIGGHKA